MTVDKRQPGSGCESCSTGVRHRVVRTGLIAAVTCLSSLPLTSVAEDALVEPIQVSVQRPVRTPLTRTLTLTAHARPCEQTIVYSKVAGYLDSIFVDRGSWVKAGQVIATIDDPETRRELERQRADAEMKQRVYERLQDAHESSPDVIRQVDLDRARGEYESSRATMEQLQHRVNFSRIRAPFDGVVTERWVDPGALIQIATNSQSASARLLQIVRFDTVRAVVDVPESDCASLAVGQRATLNLPDLGDQSFEGRVARFAWAVESSTRTMKTEIDIPNGKYTIRPGMYGLVGIVIEEAVDALVIPSKAVGIDGERRYVWIANGDHAQELNVVVGYDNGIQVEIVEGLRGDEAIISSGFQGLANGIPVSAVQADGP